jgi:uncharacterized protein YjbI with pentapeptide repeats
MRSKVVIMTTEQPAITAAPKVAYVAQNTQLPSVDFTTGGLAETCLVGAQFKSVPLTGANFGGRDITDARFQELEATSVNFAGVTARGAIFDRAQLVGGTLQFGDFSGATFTGMSMAGADLRATDFTRATFADNVVFTGSKVSTSTNLQGSNLTLRCLLDRGAVLTPDDDPVAVADAIAGDGGEPTGAEPSTE